MDCAWQILTIILKNPQETAALTGSRWDTLLRYLWNQLLFQVSPSHIIFYGACIIFIFWFKLLASLEIHGLPVLGDDYMMMPGIDLMKSCLFTKHLQSVLSQSIGLDKPQIFVYYTLTKASIFILCAASIGTCLLLFSHTNLKLQISNALSALSVLVQRETMWIMCNVQKFCHVLEQ